MAQISLAVKGMTCVMCSSAVEKAVSSLVGVESCVVNLSDNTASVVYDDKKVSTAEMIKAVKKAGYQASAEDDADPSFEKVSCDFIGAIAFAIPLFLFAMLPMTEISMFSSWHSNAVFAALFELALSLPVLWFGRGFFIKGIPSLFKKNRRMDTLVAIGSASSFLYSLYSTFRIIIGESHYIHSLYFESAAVIIALVLLGRHLEQNSRKKTNQAVEKLISLIPKDAAVIKNGKEIKTPASQLRNGDIVLVRPGERIPADGRVIDGDSFTDESALTGESIPVEKHIGSGVFCASINQNGVLKIEITSVGSETMMGKIVKMVKEASATKAPVARLADKVCAVFVPAVIAIAAVSFLAWMIAGKGFEFSLTIFVSVLVISCPCALGLATPAAIITGTGRGASMGVLYKNAEAIELSSTVNMVCFDKTGTITYGKPTLTDLYSANKADFMPVLYALEKGNDHPLALAIRSYCENRDITAASITDFELVAGKGIRGKLNGETVIAGSVDFMNENGARTEKFAEAADNIAAQGKNVIFAARGAEVLGFCAVSDDLRETVKDTVDILKKRGIASVMITGDPNRAAADHIASQVGIERYFSGIMPDKKADIVSLLQNEGYKCAFVGDGINDAPAMTCAEVGIAVASGADIAIESADIILTGSDLNELSSAMFLSRAVMRNIRENLFWAFFYNIIGIPFAAGLFYIFGGPLLNPMLAAAAMGFSSLFVVSNALRLSRFKR